MRRSLVSSVFAVALVALAGVALAGCGSKATSNADFTPTVLGTSGAGSSSGGSGGALTGAPLGKVIFTTGKDANGNSIGVTAGAGGPCARCHGADGKGVIGPDIRWSVLIGTQTSPHAPRFTLSNEADFATAITTGVAAGNQLKGIMPHFQLTSDQISGLAAYLKTL